MCNVTPEEDEEFNKIIDTNAIQAREQMKVSENAVDIMERME
jgi:hypothetical protein